MSLFVVYNMTTTEVKAVYDNTSEELLELFEKFCDFFRNTNFRNDGQGNQVQVSSWHIKSYFYCYWLHMNCKLRINVSFWIWIENFWYYSIS